jgi:transcriptional regulator with XRE-family HTH domain
MYAATLVQALKRRLKGSGITYAEVAQALELSEASIKRMFSGSDCTLQRLEDVCRVAGIDFAELAQEATAETAGMTHLTVEQEEEIVSNPALMLVALCAVGNWTFEEIVDTYALTPAQCTRYLVRLDRRRIIELQPGNRIRPLISRTFSWLPDGPIQRYFRDRVESEFLGARFDRPDELFLFVSGMLSRKSTTELIARLRRVADDFAELHRADRAMPLQQRHGTSVLLAIRPWEPRAFRSIRRVEKAPVPMGRLLGSVQGRAEPAVLTPEQPAVPHRPARRRR